MTLPRLDQIVAHWEKVPPLSVSTAAIASVLGVGRPKVQIPGAPGEDQEKQDAQARSLFELLGGGATGFNTERPAWLNKPTP